MTTEGVTDFMKSPLVTWVKKLSDESKELEYHHLCNGIFLHEIMLQIDPRPAYKDISQAVDDVVIRICNLDTVVRNVRAFYEEALGQLVIAKLPDIIKVSKEPERETSLEDIKELLLLILGCAVQCDKKEKFIEQIKCLDLLSQHALVECIQLVTDNPETVWTQEWNDISVFPEDQQEPTFRLLVHNVRRIVKERDQLWHTVNMLVVERDGNGKCMTPRGGSPGSLTDNYHLGVELADTKAKLRRMKQELEDKNEAVLELKEELEQNKTLVNKLRQESLDLLQDARAAKSYRDELDILRERASKVDKLENEIQRYKDKLNELEFYKSRVEELREDNRILVETKEMLEEQLEHSRKRTDQILELENELLKYKARVNELLLEKDADRNRIQEVIDENAILQMSAKQSMNESANLLVEIDKLRCHASSGVGNCLSEQLNKDTQLRLRKVELENQRLLSIIDNLKESSFYESNEKILELEKENKRLSLKVLQLQDLRSREFQKFLDAEQRQQELIEEIKKLQETLETVKTNGDRQQLELQREKEQLFEQVETLRQRNQKSNDARMKDIETENKKLVESTQEMKGKISRLEFDKLQLEKMAKRLKDNAERLTEVESQKLEVDRENSDLHKAIAAFKMTCDKYETLEQDHMELQAECKKLKKLLENMKTTCSKVDRLEQDNVKFIVENQKLNKALESMKAISQKLIELEQEKDDAIEANHLLKKNLEALKFDRSRYEQMELDLISQNNENTKLQKSVESYQKKIEEIENENQALELENQKLQKNIETLKVSNRRLNNLERENTDLEAENHKLDKEKKSLEKEVVRLKQATEIKDSTIDECSSKISTLERESKRLKKDLENTSHLSSRVKELEKENREVIQQSMMDKKTLITLREDLVNEKIKTQQLTNELDKLNSELQKIGLKKEKLLFAEHAQDEDRYKALENMMEEALKKSLEIKEEKIHALESRLEESAARNTQLKEELNKVRQMHEALQQRMDEEMRSSSHSEKSIEDMESKSNLTTEILQLKDHLVEVERMNATLLEENRNLKATLNNCREQLSVLQQQTLGLQHQAASLTEQNGTLQTLNAKLQVENTTLQSQNTSLSTQFSSLSAQNASIEADREQLLHHQEELQSAHEQLVSDHEALQKLHEQLSSDYETLLNELGTQKSSQKCLKQEFKNLKEKYQAVVAAQEMVESQQEALDKERELLKADTKTLSNLRAEHSRLKEDFRVLLTSNEKLKIEYKSLQSEYKTLKTEHNSFKLKNTELQGEIADSRDQVNTLDVEVSKLHSKCEMLQHMNTALDQDRRSLMSQVTTLLTQYHELLTQTLEDKDHFHEEEKSFADKLNNLRRQKEKLEEKIMEQYRKMENYSPKKKGFGANLVRKVRRAGTELMSRVPRSARSKDREKERSRRNVDSTETIDGLDDVSLGSGSVSNESPDSGSDASTLRKTSKDDDMQCTESFAEYLDQNGQSCIHRHLAFSTTALHSRKSSSPSLSMFDDHERVFRGSFSSEDIASIRADSRSSDGQLGDVESMSSSIVSAQTKHSSLQTSGDEVATNRLSLGTPGTRRAVYYPDEHDTIPTRDVGPDNDTSASKKSLSEAHNYKLNNVFNGHDLKPTISPYPLRRSDEISKSSSLSSTPLHQSLYAASTRSHSITSSPIFSSHKTLKPLLSNCIRSETVSQENLSNNTSDVSTIPQLNSTEEKALIDHTVGSQSSRKSCIITSDSSTTDIIGSARNRQSCLYPDSSLSNESATRNNNLSSCRRPNVLPVPNSPAKSPPEKSNLDNNTNSETNVAEDKPPDNSIWYEYGCV